MSDNPFAEPDDDDRTLMMPRDALLPASAGRPDGSGSPPVLDRPAPTLAGAQARRGLGARAQEAARSASAWEGGFGDLAPVGGSPIVAAAAPLLALISRLRRVVSLPDPASLRERAMLELRRYEQALRDARMPLDQIRTAHYALCASLDDVVQNTPWGSRGKWADASLVSTFHQEVQSGERFFELLRRLSLNAGKFLPVVELMYRCMSVGMQGRYRLSPRGPAELDRVREETYLIILRQRGAAEPSLSPHWQGVSAPFRQPGFRLPVWLAALIATALLGLAYAVVSLGLNADSDRSFALGLSLPPVAMPSIDRAVPARALAQEAPSSDALAGFLAPEIRQGLVSLVGSPGQPVIRIQSAGMFASGSAVITPRYLPILARIGAALKSRPGPVRIVGYTDAAPIHTVAFPSNYQLSRARAQAAGDALARTIDRARLGEEGRADADPIASNATPDGRQQNRRIEIAAPPAEDSQGTR